MTTKVRKRRTVGLDRETIESLRRLLHARKTALAYLAQRLGERVRQTDRGQEDLPSFPHHVADLASDAYEHDLTVLRAEDVSNELQDIELALERIEDGSYGLCETCLRPIAIERLQAIPYARLCVECQRQRESALGA